MADNNNDNKEQQGRHTFRGFVESNGIDWTLKFIASCAGIYFMYVTYIGNQRDAAEFAASKSSAAAVQAQQQLDTNEWAEHAYKGFNCWSRESKLYSEDTKRCTDDALLAADVEQNAQIAANASVSGANAATLRAICEILYTQGQIETCTKLP